MDSSNLLFTFDSIIDIDIGIIRLLRDKYNDPRVFYPGILEMNNKNLLYELQTRRNKNPLYIAMIDDKNQEQMDSFYNEFIKSEYDYILKFSVFTLIFGFMEVCTNSNGMALVTILCKNKQEEQYIKSLNVYKEKRINIIVEEDYSKVNILQYDCIYIKYFEDILKFKKLEAKNIFLAYYKFNFLEDENGVDVPIPDITLEIASSNILKVISAYNFDNTFIAEG